MRMNNNIEIQKTLRDILEYIGGIDPKFASDATLHSYLERLIKSAKNEQ